MRCVVYVGTSTNCQTVRGRKDLSHRGINLGCTGYTINTAENIEYKKKEIMNVCADGRVGKLVLTHDSHICRLNWVDSRDATLAGDICSVYSRHVLHCLCAGRGCWLCTLRSTSEIEILYLGSCKETWSFIRTHVTQMWRLVLYNWTLSLYSYKNQF